MKKDSAPRQHSVSANIHYTDKNLPRTSENNLTFVAYQKSNVQNGYKNYFNPVATRQYSSNYQRPSRFADSNAHQNNYNLPQKQELVESKIIETNLIKKVSVKPSEKQENILVKTPLSQLTPTQSNYSSLQTRPLLESKVITTTKSSQNDTNITVSKPPVPEMNGNVRLSANYQQNSIPWTTTTRTEVTNTFEPIFETSVVKSSQPRFDPNARFSNRIEKRVLPQVQRESQYRTVKTSQKPVNLPKESIVLSRQRNSNLPMRYSEMKKKSFEYTPVKCKNLFVLINSGKKQFQKKKNQSRKVYFKGSF